MFDEAAIRLKIKRLSEVVWEGRGAGEAVDEWLETFLKKSADRDGDRLRLLHLLSNFLYFGIREVRELLGVLYRDLYRHPILSDVRRRNFDTTDLHLIDEEFSRELAVTRFLGVGNPSASGPHLLYYLRQETGLDAGLFINHFELPGFADVATDATRYVFIDDLCATGEQAVDYSNLVVDRLLEQSPSARVSYFALLGTEAGLERTRREGRYAEVAAVMTLDETFRCFAPGSRFYDQVPPELDQARVRELCLGFGSIMRCRHPLGFGDAELAVGFNHNTPDDTLPIFWVEPDDVLPMLRPVFRRYDKVSA